MSSFDPPTVPTSPVPTSPVPGSRVPGSRVPGSRVPGSRVPSQPPRYPPPSAESAPGPESTTQRKPGYEVASRPASNRRRRLQWFLGGLGVLALLTAVSLVSWYIGGHSGQPSPDPTGLAQSPSSTPAGSPAVARGGVLPGCLAPLPAGGRCPGELECFGPVRERGSKAGADLVPCAGRHTWEAYAVGDLPAEVDAADYEEVEEDPTVRQVCAPHTFRLTTGLMDTTGWNFVVLPPTGDSDDDSIAPGERTFRCLAGRGVNQLDGPTLTR